MGGIYDCSHCRGKIDGILTMHDGETWSCKKCSASFCKDHGEVLYFDEDTGIESGLCFECPSDCEE